MNLNSATIYWIRHCDHTDPLTEGYIGVTKNFDLRMKWHLNDIVRGKHKNPHLVNAVNKYTWNMLVKEVILCGGEAYCYEIAELMRPTKTTGWNIAPGGHRGPGWTKGRKKSPESIEKQIKAAEASNYARREARLIKREARLQLREEKRILKQSRIDAHLAVRKQKATERELKREKQLAERKRRLQKKIDNGEHNLVPDRSNRPICKKCNKNVCAINYTRNGVTHYRSICDECGRKKNKLKPRKANWTKSLYKKKTTCDLCGFHSIMQTQITVFHIDGDLENIALNNLRSICLNCVEVVKKKEVTWKRGDLEVDY